MMPCEYHYHIVVKMFLLNVRQTRTVFHKVSLELFLHHDDENYEIITNIILSLSLSTANLLDFL